MREIKFRAWDKDRTEYLSAGSVFIEILPRSRPATSPRHLDVIDHPDEYRDRFIIEQFTDLKDKNGTEIYEGDILSWYNWPAEGQARCCAVVEMHCGAWGSRSLHPENEHPNDESWQPFIGEDDVADLAGGSPENEIGSQTTLVIIGNIHETPELLK